MPEITLLLESAARGDSRAAEELLPVVYHELRRIAAYKMASESAGHTLQATALVHEAWLRLVGQEGWDNRAHFFAAAAEAMRRILIEHARRKQSLKRGAGAEHEGLDEASVILAAPANEILAVNDALDQLAAGDPAAAQLVKLRYFIGMTMEEAAVAMGISKRAAESIWTYARVWLHRAIRQNQ